MSSRLCCKVCKKRWYADNLLWPEKLPKRFTNQPAVQTYKKALCKSVVDELRRTGNSPTDMTKQIIEMMHVKFERAHLAYLLSWAGKSDQRTITQFLWQETKPASFGQYGDSDGGNGISVSSHYLTDCLLHEYHHQESAINTQLYGTADLWTGFLLRSHTQSCEEGHLFIRHHVLICGHERELDDPFVCDGAI